MNQVDLNDFTESAKGLTIKQIERLLRFLDSKQILNDTEKSQRVVLDKILVKKLRQNELVTGGPK